MKTVEEKALKFHDEYFNSSPYERWMKIIKLQQEAKEEVYVQIFKMICDESKGWIDKQKHIANIFLQKIGELRMVCCRDFRERND